MEKDSLTKSTLEKILEFPLAEWDWNPDKNIYRDVTTERVGRIHHSEEEGVLVWMPPV